MVECELTRKLKNIHATFSTTANIANTFLNWSINIFEKLIKHIFIDKQIAACILHISKNF